MKKQPLFVTALLIVMLLCSAIPASASGDNEPVGVRLGLWNSTLEVTAGTPFNIRHGWVQTSDDGAIGIFDFTLEVDGVLRSEDFKLFSEEIGDPDILTRLWVYNFPDGMTGTHTFTGHWYAPCQYAITALDYQGSCATPNEKVETNSRTLVVNFVPDS